MLVAYDLATDKYPNAQVLIWGIRGYKPIKAMEKPRFENETD